MRAVGILRRFLSDFLHQVHRRRLFAVFTVVSSLIRGGRLSLTALGRSIGGRVAAKHNIKRVDRLLGNRHLHAEMPTFFAAIAHALISRISRPLILVDWTEVGWGHYALSAAVPVGGRALPLYFEVHPVKHLSSPKVERRFLERLSRDVVPSGCRPIVVTDAGFKNPWFRCVLDLGWDFVGRLSGNALFTATSSPESEKRNRRNWLPVWVLRAMATRTPKELGLLDIAKSRPLAMRVVAYKGIPKGRRGSRKVNRKGVHPGSTSYKKNRRRAVEPWLLGTSLLDTNAKGVVDSYRTRMQIEECFRDAKNHRFGWSFEDVRSRNANRLRVLLLIAALAMLAVTLVGEIGEHHGLHFGHQANTVRHRRVFSRFVLGGFLMNCGQVDNLHPSQLRRALLRIRAHLEDYSPPPLVNVCGFCGDP